MPPPSFRSPAAALIFATALLSAAPAPAAKDYSAAAVPQTSETWITAEDYPAAALSARIEGVSAIRWDISAAGMAENCTVAATSGSADLDQAACALIVARARYVPALDRKGKAVRSAATRRIRWQLPIEQPDTSVPYVLRGF